MVLDSSAIVAILMDEPEAESLKERLRECESALVGSPTLVECMMVLTPRMHRDSSPTVNAFLAQFGVEVLSFSTLHSEESHRALLQFGKGRHKAKLNFGDCMAYAVAKVAGTPLLFVGEDFKLTDVKVA